MMQNRLPRCIWLSGFLLVTPGRRLSKVYENVLAFLQNHDLNTISGISHGTQIVSGILVGVCDSTQCVTRDIER